MVVILCERQLVKYLPNMHARYPVLAIGQNGIFHLALELLLANHAHAIEQHRNGTAFAVDVDHCGGVSET